MKTMNLVAACILAAGLAAGASAQQAQSGQGTQDKGKDKANQKEGELVTVQGCLSSGGQNGYILTADPGDLTSGMTATSGGAVRTITYQLAVRDPGELQKLIGKRVEVHGRADEDARASAGVHHEKETAAKPHDDKVEPKVETTEKAKIEVKKLSVVSFKPLAGDCLTGR